MFWWSRITAAFALQSTIYWAVYNVTCVIVITLTYIQLEYCILSVILGYNLKWSVVKYGTCVFGYDKPSPTTCPFTPSLLSSLEILACKFDFISTVSSAHTYFYINFMCVLLKHFSHILKRNMQWIYMNISLIPLYSEMWLYLVQPVVFFYLN